MNVVRAHTSSDSHVDKLRAEHQARAKLAAVSGKVPVAFDGDPAFKELISKQSGDGGPANNSS